VAWDRGDRRALAGLLVLVLFAFRDAVFSGGVYFERDIQLNWHPQIEAFVRAVAGGSWPVWNPYLAFGQPLLASHIQVLYPLTWLNLVLPPWVVYTILAAAHVALAGAGLYAVCRRLAVTHTGSFVAAAAFALSGPVLSQVSTWNHLVAAAFLPWAVVAAEATAFGARPRAALGLGAAFAAQLVAGSPEVFLMTAAVVATHLACLWPRWRAETLRPALGRVVAALLGAGLFGAALAAGAWMPLLELGARSARGEMSTAARAAWSLHPWSLGELSLAFRWNEMPLLPRHIAEVLQFREPLFRSMYLGAAALGLALAASARRPSIWWGLVLLLALSLAFSLGPRTPLLELAGAIVPPLRMVRFPVKALVVACYSFAVLAGLGCDAWARGDVAGRRGRLRVWAPWIAVLGLGAVLALAALLMPEALGPYLVRPLAGSYAAALGPTARRLALSVGFGLAAAVVLAAGRRLGRERAATAAAALALADLLAVHASLNPVAPRDLFRFRPDVLQYIDQADHSRLFVRDYTVASRRQAEEGLRLSTAYTLERAPVGWGRAQALALGVQMYLNPPLAGRWGLHSSYDLDLQDLYPRPMRRLTEHVRDAGDPAVHLRLLQAGGVTRALSLDDAPWTHVLEPVATLPGLFREPIRVFRVPDARPRTYAVGEARVVADDEMALAILGSAGFDAAREVLLAPSSGPFAAGDSLASPAPGAAPFAGSSRLVSLQADRVRLEAELGAAGHVVLLDAYDPGWRVSVDGRPAGLERANVGFRAVRLPPGRHDVEQVYRPRVVVTGLAASGLAALAAAAVLVLDRRRGGPSAPPRHESRRAAPTPEALC
jgi:hypothetical protein